MSDFWLRLQQRKLVARAVVKRCRHSEIACFAEKQAKQARQVQK